jgi:hypothetical protein
MSVASMEAFFFQVGVVMGGEVLLIAFPSRSRGKALTYILYL